MAVKARDDVTLASIADVANVRRYYLLQSSTLNAPAAPTVNPAPAPWVTTEPSYSEGSTNTLYTVDLTVFTDGTFDYSQVSKSSSYEAAKVAYNKAVAAVSAATGAQNLAGLKTAVTAAVTAPSNPLVGDIWFPLNASGQVIGMKICTKASPVTWSDYLIVAGKILVPGTVGATEIGPDGIVASNIKASQELWGKLASFVKITTEMLTAGGAKITGLLLADVIQLGTRIVAGNPNGTRAELDPYGLHVYRKLKDGTTAEVARFGTDSSDDYIGILDAEGNTLAAIDDAGNGSFASVDAGDTFYWQGTEMADMIRSQPWGVLARTSLSSDMIFSTGWSRATYASIPYPVDRLLRLTFTGHFDATGNVIRVTLRQSAGSSVSNGNSVQKSWTVPASRSGSATSITCVAYVTTSSESSVGEGNPYTLGFFVATTSGTARVVTSGSSVDSTALTEMVIEDVGPALDVTSQSGYTPHNGGSGSNSDTTTTKRTKTVTGSWGQSYTIAGATTTGMDPYAVQGSGGGPARMSMIGFPSIISDLSGATVNKVEVFLYFAHWWNNSGGTAGIGYHGQTSKPSSWSGTSASLQVGGMPKPGGKWITLPSSTYASFKSGAYRGITLRAPGDSTATVYYGYAVPGKCQLRYTFTK